MPGRRLIHISVVICTWNRCQLLLQTLEKMATALRVPANVTWDLLIVDNGSTDETQVVIESFSDRLPIRRLYEPEPGLSRARNLAVEHARGDYIVWTDDDVLVDEGWLEAYCQAFQRWPEAAVFGGPIEPWFLDGKPAWIDEVWSYVSGTYAVLDLGASPLPLTAHRLPYGANMAVRMREQRRFLYDVRLGHQGNDKIGAEETVMMQSILRAEGSGWWVPEARVQHLIPRERLTIGYLQQYYGGRGQRLFLEAAQRGAVRSNRAGQVARAVFWEAVYQTGRLLRLPLLWIRALRRGWIARGFVEGHDRQVERQRTCIAEPAAPAGTLASTRHG